MGFFSSLVDPLTSAFNLGIGKGGSGFGETMNKITGVYGSMDKSYEQQLKASAYQNAYNTAMWNKQNEYNSPAAQLARMREAGIDINPTSYALGTGNLSNTATFAGAENGFAGSGSPAGNPISMALGVANGIADIRNKMAQNQLLEDQSINTSTLTRSHEIENKIKNHNLKYAENHNLPYGSTPSISSAGGDVVNSIKAWLARNLGKTIDLHGGKTYNGQFDVLSLLGAYNRSKKK